MVMRRDDVGLLPTDVISTRRTPGGYPNSTPYGGDNSSALVSAIAGLGAKMDALAAQIAVSGLGGSSAVPSYGQPVQFQPVSLFTANTWKAITVPAGMRYCTAYCDGALNGVKLALKEQSNTPIELDRFPTFEIHPDVSKVYVTSDVRPGRSVLILAFSGSYPTQANISHPEFLELAARTSALPTYDRRGQLLWQDDFEGTQLKWTPVTSGGVAHIGVTSTTPYRGNQCVRIATDALLADQAYIYHRCPVPINKQIGFEIAIMFDSSFDDGSVDISPQIDTGGSWNAAHLYLVCASSVWTIKYYTAGGTTATLSTSWAPHAFYHIVKVVIDADTHKWIRVMVDDQQFNMHDIALRSGVSTYQQMDLIVSLSTNAAAQREIWVDNAILTHNEPIDVLVP